MRRRGLLTLAAAVALAPVLLMAQGALPQQGAPMQFTLTATDGTAVSEQTYRGKWLAIYFGYTFCPDVCPTTMLEIAGALKALGPRADTVQGIFITVDPQRDRPKVLAEYLKSFDQRLIGLTGTPAEINAASKTFHVFYERNDANDGAYSYDHSAFVYLVDPDGKFAKAVIADGDGRQIADTLTALMKTRP
jgi:protein SCO1